MRSDTSLRNDCNDGDVSVSIKEYFSKYPRSTARECCRQIGLDYKKYGGRARKIKHDLKRFRQSIVSVTDQHGRLLKPLIGIHRGVSFQGTCSGKLCCNSHSESSTEQGERGLVSVIESEWAA